MTSLTLPLLAQQGGTPSAGSGGLGSMLLLFAPMLLILYFMVMRPQSQEKKRRNDMITKIKKNDRVVTIGGVVGTVVSVKDDEVTLKVDESNNTKITFLKAAIQRVTAADSAATVASADVKK